MTRNRVTNEIESRQLTDEDTDAGYLSGDHFDALDALHKLRMIAERELLRMSWLMSMPLIPSRMYSGITRRVIADALDVCWGDHDAARVALSPELHKYLLWLVSDRPMSDLDWAMRIFALSDNAPRPGSTDETLQHIVSKGTCAHCGYCAAVAL